MTVIELFKAIINLEAHSTVIVSGPAGNYALLDVYEEDDIVYIDVCPTEDTPS